MFIVYGLQFTVEMTVGNDSPIKVIILNRKL